jgi:preprotein translocase subunit SecE
MPKQNDKPGIVVRIRTFIQEVKAELSKVAWPSKGELKSHTSVVMFMLFIMAAIIYVYDLVSFFAVKLLLLLS